MIHLQDILDATQGVVPGPVFAREFTDFCYDSRIVRSGDLFLAVKTEKADGHDYIDEACRGGAAGVLCERGRDLSQYGVTCVQVPGTREAIAEWARYVLTKSGIEVVGVAGSTGKTSTKEAVAAVLG
jgi:UDP-N-acetylmuramyl pentapeptide synthase